MLLMETRVGRSWKLISWTFSSSMVTSALRGVRAANVLKLRYGKRKAKCLQRLPSGHRGQMILIFIFLLGRRFTQIKADKTFIKFCKPRPVGGEPMAGFPKGRRIPLGEGGVKAPPENASVPGGTRSPCRGF